MRGAKDDYFFLRNSTGSTKCMFSLMISMDFMPAKLKFCRALVTLDTSSSGTEASGEISTDSKSSDYAGSGSLALSTRYALPHSSKPSCVTSTSRTEFEELADPTITMQPDYWVTSLTAA